MAKKVLTKLFCMIFALGMILPAGLSDVTTEHVHAEEVSEAQGGQTGEGKYSPTCSHDCEHEYSDGVQNAGTDGDYCKVTYRRCIKCSHLDIQKVEILYYSTDSPHYEEMEAYEGVYDGIWRVLAEPATCKDTGLTEGLACIDISEKEFPAAEDALADDATLGYKDIVKQEIIDKDPDNHVGEEIPETVGTYLRKSWL